MNNAWNDFCAFFCLNVPSYIDRRKDTLKELERIGIDISKNFYWMLNFVSPMDKILYDVTKKMQINECKTINEFDCALGHYRMIKSAYEMGLDNAVFLEDDNLFLKNTDELHKMVSSYPKNYDVILFSTLTMGGTTSKFNRYKTEKSINEYYCEFDGEFWSTSFYYLSRNAMEKIIASYEKKICSADCYTSTKEHFEGSENLKRAVSKKNLAIQKELPDDMHKGASKYYERMHCDLNDYS